MVKTLTESDTKPLNLDVLDGFKELPSDADKERIKKALEQGHIDDADLLHEEGGNRTAEKKAAGAKKAKGSKKVTQPHLRIVCCVFGSTKLM